jgi:hypothetical protein
MILKTAVERKIILQRLVFLSKECREGFHQLSLIQRNNHQKIWTDKWNDRYLKTESVYGYNQIIIQKNSWKIKGENTSSRRGPNIASMPDIAPLFSGH